VGDNPQKKEGKVIEKRVRVGVLGKNRMLL